MRDPVPDLLPIPDPGVKKVSDPQHWKKQKIFQKISIYSPKHLNYDTYDTGEKDKTV